MKKPLLLGFDMSSFIWTHLSVGKDTENGITVTHNDKPVHVNSAQYGYDNVMDRMLGVLKEFKRTPIDCILAFEGLNSKGQRLLISSDYKGGGGPSRPPEAYVEFEKLREMLKETWKGLGAQTMWQDYAEGDDTLAWLAENTEEDLVVCTFDNDLTTLNMTNKFGARVRTWINHMVEYNKYGTFDYDLVTTYKALVGDSSDNIKGCVGFGPGAWEKIRAAYGDDGVREIHDMLLASNLNPLANAVSGPQAKLLQKIVDQAPQVLQSFDLARLRPQWVNTMRKPLTWEPGMVRQRRKNDDPRLKEWYGQTRLVTADNFEAACEWAIPRILASREVALDIETSTPDESDQWLADQGDIDGVDTFGSTLTGMGLTFGENNQFTLYFSVDHADTNNISSEALRQFIAAVPRDIPFIIQNAMFELTVLFNEWAERQLDNGYHGFLPNILDTQLEASYVDENIPRGLKQRSHGTLGYVQQTFAETTRLTAHPDDLFPGGRIVGTTYEQRWVGTGLYEPLSDEELAAGATPVEMGKWVTVLDADGEPIVATETRQYKMRELSGEWVLGYGADDTICTMALHNYYRLFMQFEHTYEVYKQVEIGATYMHAKSFIDGCDISLEQMKVLEKEDDETYAGAWATLRTYLMEQGWAGTQPPTYTVNITPADIKDAFFIVTGRRLDTMMRTPSKLVTFIRETEGEAQFAGMLHELAEAKKWLEESPESVDPRAIAKVERDFTAYVRSCFKGEPDFNDGSPKQMQKLMYDVMELPIRVRNKPTEIMRKAGINEGTAKTDALAINYALQDCLPEQKPVLLALQLMGMVGTRRSLFYGKYPYFPHWKDGKVRSSHNQSATNTRRASESKPNKQQLPKHPKIDGHQSKFREVIVPHRTDAVIVSIDFKAQELRIMADQSQDPVMLSMYIGENKRDQHTLTASAIAQREDPDGGWSYEVFAAAYGDENHPEYKWVKKIRGLGKKLNFTAEYGAMAAKVAITLMISEDAAQLYLDAREEMFEVSKAWKEQTIKEVKETGIVRTMMGAVRHLGPALTCGDKWISSKAERQAVNFKIQGSAAEQTKTAEGRCWEDDLFFDFDAVYIGPIHDELVASVRICDLVDFLPRFHAAIVAPYGGMQVPIEGDISFGLDFFNQTEIGAAPTREAIEAGIEKMYANKAKRDTAKRAKELEAA